VRLTLPLPAGFRFRSVVLSHGWADLPPFRFDPERETLSVNLLVRGRTPVTAELSQKGRSLAVAVRSRAPLGAAGLDEVRAAAATVLRLDSDLAPFHREAARHPEFRWVRTLGAGRLLRAPTVFEDTVKMICTTNCSWALTRNMVTNLCETLGRGGAGAKTFPTPAAMADRPESFYRREIRSGYRSAYLVELSRRVANGDLEIERWRDPSLSAAAVREEISSVNGVGPYAAGNILKLIGRYDELGIDSWCRKQFSLLHRRGRPAADRAIEKHYAGFGEWKGLFFWLDLTKEWYEKSYGEIFGT
jgi:3-methyladenine DNA glycosylase/8-oxoguanine DNA glycosylase